MSGPGRGGPGRGRWRSRRVTTPGFGGGGLSWMGFRGLSSMLPAPRRVGVGSSGGGLPTRSRGRALTRVGLNGLRSISIQPCSWGDGAHSVRGVAVDTGGLEASSSAAATVRVDCTPPVVSVDVPGWRWSRVIVSSRRSSASDATSGVQRVDVEVSVDGGAWGSAASLVCRGRAELRVSGAGCRCRRELVGVGRERGGSGVSRRRWSLSRARRAGRSRSVPVPESRRRSRPRSSRRRSRVSSRPASAGGGETGAEAGVETDTDAGPRQRGLP